MIELAGVSKVYRAGEAPALDGVSLRVGAGQAVALLGPSGAGKSTLLRCLNGLVRPDAGAVRVAGRPVHALPDPDLRALRRQVGVVFQEFSLIDRMTVLRNVMVGCCGRYPFWRAALGVFPADDVARAERILERVGLRGLGEQPARELSGGQRQRVAIARALVQEPRLILGDEPVSSLDPVTARSILGLLTELAREEGITLLLSLHDVELARAFCVRAVGLAGGRVVFDGAVDQLTPAVLDRIYGDGARAVPGSLPETAGRGNTRCAGTVTCQ